MECCTQLLMADLGINRFKDIVTIGVSLNDNDIKCLNIINVYLDEISIIF